jgi:phosphoserine phosphatase
MATHSTRRDAGSATPPARKRSVTGAGRAVTRLSAADVETILDVTRALAAPFDLHTMLEQVTAEAIAVLRAERASVWLYDIRRNELFIEVARDLGALRLPLGQGLAGVCARDRVTINVRDCYADARFDRSVDEQTGFKSRCCLTLPLVDHRGELVGVMQVLNQINGGFDTADVALAEALAAQCAVALSRVRMTDDLLAGEVLRREMELASAVQRSTLPEQMPDVSGYQMHAVFQPASLTGGDVFDLALIEQGLLILLGDAAGHGLAPALSVTRMHAMLRMALRMGADLETAYRHVNDLLVSSLPDARFVTACIALLDPATHRIRMLSAGQGPILRFDARQQRCERFGPHGLPLGVLPLTQLDPAADFALAPGDWFVLFSDGVFEFQDAHGAMFGHDRVEQLLLACAGDTPCELARRLLAELAGFGGDAPQDDDITMVLVKRTAPAI